VLPIPLSATAKYTVLRANPADFYRIVILPWPEFTDAFKEDSKDGGGDLIEGITVGAERGWGGEGLELKF
jgi:hypothetical protein